MPRFIVEADGGSRGNPGPAAYGAVVRDAETGQVLAERAEYIGTSTNNVAEYRGLIAGLTAAVEIDPDATVEARLDSKLVVEQLSGRWKIKHPSMRPLALQAREILPVERVTYTWVPRERNKHADRLANEALDAAARGETWSESTSSAALSVSSSGSEEPVVDEAEVEPPPANTLVGWDIDLGTPTTTLLLRHGQTEHTVRKLFSGSGGEDPPLNATGQAQAAAAAAALTDRGITSVVSSPMLRARETAGVVASALGLPVREVDDLRECAFGAWEGRSFAEVREEWPNELAAWLGSTSVTPPGGESFDAVGLRVRRARDQLLARYPEGTVLVVSHVTPIKTLVQQSLGAPTTALYRMELSPASLTEIQWYSNGNASLRSFNEVFG
ncbi:MAG: ribonuclease / adenosylcobalamin/alpha-ribazole phosphatase [Nocardioidaceae bacterium]|nr:ribonuclease / adenosylcobalamin/alpha-ribazole phosphatase [Nocardioidaceae bacterium]